MRIHIVRQTGAPPGEHAFLGHRWWQNDCDGGIARGVLESSSIITLLGVLKAQRADVSILCTQYLIGATRAGSNALSLYPIAPLPRRHLIFLHKDDDLRAWLLAKDGKHPLDLMVRQSRLEEAGDNRLTPEHVWGKPPFFDHNVRDHSEQAEDIVGGIEWGDQYDQDDHIVVRNRRMRQQSGERWEEMEEMDDDEDDKGADCEEDDSEEDVAEGERQSQMPPEHQIIVIDVSLLYYSYLEEYQARALNRINRTTIQAPLAPRGNPAPPGFSH